MKEVVWIMVSIYEKPLLISNPADYELRFGEQQVVAVTNLQSFIESSKNAEAFGGDYLSVVRSAFPSEAYSDYGYDKLGYEIKKLDLKSGIFLYFAEVFVGDSDKKPDFGNFIRRDRFAVVTNRGIELNEAGLIDAVKQFGEKKSMQETADAHISDILNPVFALEKKTTAMLTFAGCNQDSVPFHTVKGEYKRGPFFSCNVCDEDKPVSLVFGPSKERQILLLDDPSVDYFDMLDHAALLVTKGGFPKERNLVKVYRTIAGPESNRYKNNA